MDGAKEDGFHFIPFAHHLRLLIHIERGRQLPMNHREPHHSCLKLVPKLFFQQWQDFPIEPVTMRAVEVRELDQLHLPGRMRGHLTLQDFELALQLGGRGGSR
jgi:hypothetical protein